MKVRKPAVAGMFYPSQREILTTQIQEFFQKTKRKQTKSPQILIVPHAGYQYSGLVAAYGFRQLEDSFSKVILLGPSHQAYFFGGVVDENQFWETPLGRIRVDQNLSKKIVEANFGVSFSSFVHQKEHSLEVELPFLQIKLKNFQIIPLLLGQVDENFLEKLTKALLTMIDKKTLVVISSDFSHYPSYEIATQVDKKTIASILSADPDKFQKTVTSQTKKGFTGLATCACGKNAILVGMKIAQKLVSGQWQLLAYANSGDVTSDKERVVGYAAVGWYPKEDKLNHREQKKLLRIARKTLENYLQKKKIPQFRVTEFNLLAPRGVFVTLKKDGQLRGCLGVLKGKGPLYKEVQKMVIQSAVGDPRFPPVSLNELKKIKIEISVLSPLKRVKNPDEIKIGVHGVMIEKGFHRGVFLPQVALETGWDKETFMGQLCVQKAGLPWDSWKKGDVNLYIFTTQVLEE